MTVDGGYSYLDGLVADNFVENTIFFLFSFKFRSVSF